MRKVSKLAGVLPADVMKLKGKEMSRLLSIDGAYLFAEKGIIHSFGRDEECPFGRADVELDCSDRMVMPAFCDSHTHLVFAAWRENEFVDRIGGLTYEEIAARGGGILHSASKLQNASEDDLFTSAQQRMAELISLGTGAIEIKSGYGLTTESELKMLRVIRRLKDLDWIPVKSTFLGAHAIPATYQQDRQGYIRLLTQEMLPRIHQEGLADYVDVFCDRGFFTPEETDMILTSAARYGLQPKIHANELDYSGGIQTGVRHHAVSIDHLEYTGDNEIEALSSSETIATILPSTAFFLGLPYAPARKMIDSNLCVALASDYNPGSSPSGNMSFIYSLGCIKLKMLPAEAFNAVTINGAAAMELSSICGSITPGKKANLIISKKGASPERMPYHYSQHMIDQVIINGRVF